MPFFCAVETTIPLRCIIIPPNGKHVLAAAFINGQLATVLIDTGASQTVMDSNRLGLFSPETEFESTGQLSKGLGTDGMESFHFTVSQFILGDLVLESMRVTLLDLAHVNRSYEELGFAPIDMVIGGDMLSTYEAVVDYGRLEMLLMLP